MLYVLDHILHEPANSYTVIGIIRTVSPVPLETIYVTIEKPKNLSAFFLKKDSRWVQRDSL